MDKNVRRRQLYQDTLLRWCNTKLTRSTLRSIQHLAEDGAAVLSELINRLSDGKYSQYIRKGTRRLYGRGRSQLTSCCHFLSDEQVWITHKQTLKQDLESGDIRLLHLLADLLLHYDVVYRLRPDQTCHRDARYLLLTWINQTLPHGQTVSNFTSDWRDGRALGALLNGIASDMCSGWHQWDTENCVVNITQAMETAHSHLIGIDKLLGPTDMCYSYIMDINIIAYLSQLLGARLGRAHGYRKVLQSPGDDNTISVERVFPVEETDRTVSVVGKEGQSVPMTTEEALETQGPVPPRKFQSDLSRQTKARQLPPIPPPPEELSVIDNLSETASTTVSTHSLKYLNLDISEAAKNMSQVAAQTIPKTPYPGSSQNQYTAEPGIPIVTGDKSSIELDGPANHTSHPTLIPAQDKKTDPSSYLYDETIAETVVSPYDRIPITHTITQASQATQTVVTGAVTTKSVQIQVGADLASSSQGLQSFKTCTSPKFSGPDFTRTDVITSACCRPEDTPSESAMSVYPGSDYLLKQHSIETDITDSGITSTRPSSISTGMSDGILSADYVSPGSTDSSLRLSVLEDIVKKLPKEVQCTIKRYMETDIDIFKPGRVVSTGESDSTGVYHRCRYKKADLNQIVLAKSIPGELSAAGVRCLMEEAHTLTMLTHANILQLVGIVVIEGQLYTLMPRVDRGTLQEYLHTSHQEHIDLDLADKLVIGLQVARAMDHVTSLDYVVQNLHTLTCMVTNDKVVMLADLSATRDIITGGSITYTGDLNTNYRWLAPEVLTTKQYGVKADTWRCGILLWSVFNNGMEPYDTSEMNSVIYDVAKGVRPPETADMSPEIYKLLLACWAEQTTIRIRLSDMCDMITSLLLGGGDGYNKFYSTYVRATNIKRSQSYCQIPGDEPIETTPTLPPRQPIMSPTEYTTTKHKKTVAVEPENHHIDTQTTTDNINYPRLVQNRRKGYSNVVINPPENFGDMEDIQARKSASW